MHVDFRHSAGCCCRDIWTLRAAGEERRGRVTGADGVARTRVETGHQRPLATVVGQVRVTRMAYRAPGAPSVHPADAALSLPAGKHSHGLRRLAALEAVRGSFAAPPLRSAGLRPCGPGNARWRSWPGRPRPTWTASTPGPGPRRVRRPPTCWCCRPTARASSCAPADRFHPRPGIPLGRRLVPASRGRPRRRNLGRRPRPRHPGRPPRRRRHRHPPRRDHRPAHRRPARYRRQMRPLPRHQTALPRPVRRLGSDAEDAGEAAQGHA